MNYINEEYIETYIRNLLPESTASIKALEEYALMNHVPIIHPEVAQLLRLLLKIHGCRSVLEIGTAIGYSATIFSNAMGKDARVVTIERNPEMIKIARENIRNNGLEKNVIILEGQAEEILPTVEERFDCIFVDAAKGHYMDFFPKCMKLLKSGGILISDNVLFRGMVATDKLVKRRKITIVKRMRKYLDFISDHPQLTTSVIPIGDGLAISLKKE